MLVKGATCDKANLESQSMSPIMDGVSTITAGSIRTTNPNPLKLFVPVDVLERLLANTFDTSLSHNVYQILITESDVTL